MRTKINLIGKIFLVELLILLLIGVVFYFQFSSVKEEFVNKTRFIAETIGDQASTYFSDISKEPTSDKFFLFLDERIGREKLFNILDISPEFFSIVFKKDMDKSSVPGHFNKDFYPTEEHSVTKSKGISVAVPFITSQQSEPFGVVEIGSDSMAVLKQVFSDNFLLYVAMLVVFNNQAYILYLFAQKKKEEVLVDKGYLKEHSVGALKIMHKVLGDVIEDHSTASEKSGLNHPKTDESAKNVIPISKLIVREKK